MQSLGRAVLCSLLLLAIPALAQDFKVPALQGAVSDYANMLDSQTENSLASWIQTFMKQGGAEILVLTVDDIGDEPIEDASIKIAEEWKLGAADKDDGVLLFIVKSQRLMRIEVGGGLEGELTDAAAKRIIEDEIQPRFKSGDFDGGVVAGVLAIASRTNSDLYQTLVSVPQTASNRRAHPQGPVKIDWLRLLIGLGFLIFLIATPIGRTLLLYMFIFGGSGGRGRGGFGGSGGGFGGRGGGFSGGGASGGW